MGARCCATDLRRIAVQIASRLAKHFLAIIWVINRRNRSNSINLIIRELEAERSEVERRDEEGFVNPAAAQHEAG